MKKILRCLLLLFVCLLLVVAAGWGAYLLAMAYVRQYEECIGDRAYLARLELLYRDMSPTHRFTTDLNELTSSHIRQGALTQPNGMSDYWAEEKADGSVVIHCKFHDQFAEPDLDLMECVTAHPNEVAGVALTH